MKQTILASTKLGAGSLASLCKNGLAAACLFATIIAARGAEAAVIEFSYVNAYPWISYAVSNPVTQEHPYLSGSGGKTVAQVLITVTSGDGMVQTGDSFYAFSADIFREFTQPVQADFTQSMANWAMHGYGPGAAGVNAAKLYNENGGGAALDAESAYALQLAIWEVLYEPGGNFDVTQGNTVFINGSTFNPEHTATYNRIVAQANQYLSRLPYSTASGDAAWVRTADNLSYPLTHSADLIAPALASVPLPSSLLLMAGGLIALSSRIRPRVRF